MGSSQKGSFVTQTEHLLIALVRAMLYPVCARMPVMRDRAEKTARIVTACAFCLLIGACNSVTVRETTLSTRQRVAMVSSPGDGISPPTNVVLFEERPGRYTPIAAGFAQAPVTSFLQGAGAGIALGIGAHGTKTKVSVQGTSSARSTGGTATGGTGTGGSVALP